MNRNNRSRGNRNNYNRNQTHDRKPQDTSDNNNPVIQCFRQYAQELDDKHDRYERILKQSRDITIESKRIIFLLHTADARKQNFSTVLGEAKTRLDALCQHQFANIAKELIDRDQYQFSRAYSPGLQEFVEALTYHFYLSNEKWENWSDLQKRLTYTLAPSKPTETITDDGNTAEESTPQEKPIDDELEQTSLGKEYYCQVQPIEYILGLADLGGEVMRRCVSSLGNGDIDACFNATKFMQTLYTCYVGIGNTRHRDIEKKIYVFRQSLMKTEQVCYNIKVRGSEAAVWSADGSDKTTDHDDEGFSNY